MSTHIASHRIASHRIASHRIASQTDATGRIARRTHLVVPRARACAAGGATIALRARHRPPPTSQGRAGLGSVKEARGVDAGSVVEDGGELPQRGQELCVVRAQGAVGKRSAGRAHRPRNHWAAVAVRHVVRLVRVAAATPLTR